MVVRLLQGAMVVVLALALGAGGSALAAQPGGPDAGAAKKKKRKHCRAGYKRTKVHRHGKVRYRCVKKKKAKPQAPATTPQTQSGPSAPSG